MHGLTLNNQEVCNIYQGYKHWTSIYKSFTSKNMSLIFWTVDQSVWTDTTCRPRYKWGIVCMKLYKAITKSRSNKNLQLQSKSPEGATPVQIRESLINWYHCGSEGYGKFISGACVIWNVFYSTTSRLTILTKEMLKRVSAIFFKVSALKAAETEAC